MERKLSRDEEDKSTEDKEPSELKQIFHRFKERSTLPAVGVMQQKISLFWRIVWILVVVCGIIVSIYQSIEVVNNYLRYPTFLTEIEVVNSSVLFPAVTLCSQNLIDWKRIKERNHSILHVIERAVAERKTTHVIDRRVQLEELLMEELYRLEWDERQEFLYTPDEWLRFCFIQSYNQDSLDCLNDIPTAHVYSPYYGPCITINPGLDKETRLRETSKNRMILIAEFPRELEFPYMARSNGMLVSIHAPGTAPVIQLSKHLEVLPGEWLFATMDLHRVKRLPAPFASNCSSNESPLSQEIHKFSPYQTNETHYAYSREECLATCFFVRMLEEKHCINFFTASKKEKYPLFSVNLCKNNSFDSDFIENAEDYCTDICQKRCIELIYDWAPMTLNIPKHKGYLYDLLDVSSENNKTNIDEMVFVTLKMESSVFIYGEETAKYELEDIFGAIGGNLGLWIGVSILTVFEVFELITSLFIYFIKRLFCCCLKQK